jgi:hypothetical protein
VPAFLALVADQLGDFGRQRKTMTVEVERHHRVVVDDVVHGEFEQSGVLQPEEECQGASRADIGRQRIIDETPVQLFGLVLVRAEDAGRGDGGPGDYELAGQAPASRPGDEGTHFTTFLARTRCAAPGISTTTLTMHLTHHR